MSSRDKIIAIAREHADQGRYDLAIRQYERLVAAHPDDLRSRIKLGFLHARNNDPQMAVEVWLEAAHAYERRGATAEAAVVLQQVLQLSPDHVDAHLWLAQLLASLGQPAESRRALEGAHELLEQRGRMFEAMRVLEDMVALDPGNVALCIRLGEAYAARDMKEEAVDVLTRAADVLRVAEWVDDFIRVAERLVWLQPDNVALNRELAVHYLRQRDPQSALQKLQRCYEADQGDPDTLKLLADTFIDLREPEKGATILRVLAEVYEQRGEPERADAVLDHAYRLDPEFQPEEIETTAAPPPGEGERMDPRASQSDPTLLELEEGDWTWLPPAAADAADLSPLEMSLQPDGPEDGAPRRFLPAVTAEGRHGREATSPQHRTVTTQELDLSDLIFLEQRRAATTQVTSPSPQRRASSGRVVATTELDLADLEEVAPDPRVAADEVASSEREVTDRPDLSTHERALNDLENLAGELSDRYLGAKSRGAKGSREKETVKYRHTAPRPRTDARTHPDGRAQDTRPSRRPEGPSSDTTQPSGRGGRRSRR